MGDVGQNRRLGTSPFTAVTRRTPTVKH